MAGFELYSRGDEEYTGCDDTTMDGGYTTNNVDNTVSIHHYEMATDKYNYCFRAWTDCDSSYVYASFSPIEIDDILEIHGDDPYPMGSQTFDYDATVSSFVITPDGFEDFFDVDSDIENDVTCQLLASDCSSTLVGTQADGSSSLSGTHVSFDSSLLSGMPSLGSTSPPFTIYA